VIVIKGINDPTPLYGFAILTGCALLASITSLFIKEDLRRLSFSKNNSEVSIDMMQN